VRSGRSPGEKRFRCILSVTEHFYSIQHFPIISLKTFLYFFMEHLLQCLRVSYRRFRDDERIKKVDDDVLCRLLSHRRWLRAGVPFIDAYRRDRSQRVGRVHAYRYARRCITTTGNIALNLALNFKFAVAPVFPLGKFPR